MRILPVSSAARPLVTDTAVAIATDASDRDSVTASYYQSLKPTRHRHRRWCDRVLYAYPRLSFVLVLLASSVGTSAFVAYRLAMGTLALTGARTALATARTRLVATELTLERATACAVDKVPSQALRVRTRVEAGVTPWQEDVRADDAALQDAKARFSACATNELNRLELLLIPAANATARLDPQTRACLVASLERSLDRFASSSLDHVVQRVQKIRWKAAVHDTLETMTTARHNATRTFHSRVANAADAIVTAVDTWVDALEAFVEKQLATVGMADIAWPALPVSAELEAMLGLSRTADGDGEQKNALTFVSSGQILTALRGVVGTDRTVRRAVDAVESSMREMQLLLTKLDQREAEVRREVSELEKTVRVSLEPFKSALRKLRDAVVLQTRASIQTMAAVVDDEDLSDALDLARSRLYREWIPANAVNNDTHAPLDRVMLEPTFAALDKALRPYVPAVKQRERRDSWMLRASLYDASALFVTVVLTLDALSRLGWFLGKVAQLLTDSYSDLPPVDIRETASITTLIDIWGILMCRHDLGSVVYAMMTEGSYVVETVVHFVLWVLLEIAGTLSLIEWNQDISRRCRPRNGVLDIQATTPSATMTYLISWLVDPTDRSPRPMATVEQRISIFNQALDDDERAWRRRVHSVAKTQSKLAAEMVLEQNFLLDMREGRADCTIELEPSPCSLEGLEGIEVASGWESDAADAFHLHRSQVNFTAEVLVAECIAQGHQLRVPAVEVAQRLVHAQSCLVDQTLYLTFASWWMVLVIILALRLILRMVTKAVGMVFWRYLSADRLEVLAYSDDTGLIESTDRLPKAIRRHLRNIRWRVAARMCGVALAVSSVVVVGLFVLPSAAMAPMM